MWWKKSRMKDYQMQQNHDIIIALEQRRRADRAKDRAIEQTSRLEELSDEFTQAMRHSFRGRHTT